MRENLTYQAPTPERPEIPDAENSARPVLRGSVSAGLALVLSGAVVTGAMASVGGTPVATESTAHAPETSTSRSSPALDENAAEHKPRKAQGGAGSGQSRDRVGRWIAKAITIMRDKGVPVARTDHDEIRTVIEKESSANPRAINRWDSNAAAGHPSKGLMQTIEPTFASYKLPGHGDIYDPVDNIIAGVRYTLDRYGGFSGHPGLASLSSGGGYQGY